MASVAEHPHAATSPPASVVAAHPPRPARLARVVTGTRTLLRSDAPVLLVVVAAGVLVRAVGMASMPVPGDAEGRLVSAAWATLHQATDPTGSVREGVGLPARLPVAVWLGVTGALERAPGAVAAGREAALVASTFTLVLLWMLARRLELPRWAAGLAVLLVAVAPVAVELQRTVSAATLATPWVLAALLLALARRRVPASLAAAAGCLAVAVLTAPVALLALPGFALVLWRHRQHDARAAADAVGVLLLALAAAVVLAAVTDLSIPVLDGGSVPGPGGGILALVTATSLAATVLRRLRPVAVSSLLLGALAVLGPEPARAGAVTLLVPLAALCLVGTADGFVRYRPTRLGRRRVHLSGGLGATLVAGLVVGLLAPGWSTDLRGLTGSGADDPLARTVALAAREVPPDGVVLTAPVARVDLLRQGRGASRIVAVRPSGVTSGSGPWWVLATAGTRDDPAAASTLALARARGDVAAVYGTGEERVELLRVPGAEASAAPVPAPARPRSEDSAASALLANPAVTFTGDAREVLTTERVDTRLLGLLAVLSAGHDLTVDALPVSVPGEPRRSARIIAIDGAAAVPGTPAAREVAEVVDAQVEPFRAVTVWFPAVGETPAALVVSIPEESP